MNTIDKLNQARIERSLSYQMIASKIDGISTPKVKAVFETESPDQRDLRRVLDFFGIEEEDSKPYRPISSPQPLRSPTKTKIRNLPTKEKIVELRKVVKDHQDKSTLKKAKGQSCVKCGKNDGTVVSCHYNGPIQHKLGQGMGCKVNDYYTAFLCHTCHAEVDQKKFTKGVASELAKVWASHEMLEHIIETLIIKLKGEE